ncbi:hypothetical protein Q7O_001582 [Pectobacterium carotovorum subsp. carotovorum PCCS1]|nr:hypothetical protein [Pectobacterium carotovorum subsp. carotovorum PCCS1]
MLPISRYVILFAAHSNRKRKRLRSVFPPISSIDNQAKKPATRYA